MAVFFVIATLLAVAAALFGSAPLLRATGRAAPPERTLAAIAAVVLIATAFTLYLLLSHGTWRTPAASAAATAATAAGPLNETIESLLQTTQQHPEQVQGWLRLGSGYLRANQWPLARRSFRRADSLAGGHSAEALVGLAQTVDIENEGNETDAALNLYERALQLDPQSAPALFYSALALMRAGHLPAARARFATLLASGPPATVSAALAKQIESLDAAIAADAQAAQVKAATTLHLTIELAPALRSKVARGATLFVFVRSPQGGPPLAAKRLQPTFPQLVELSAADSMIAGSSFAAGQKVLVVARVSASGAPTGAPGDLSGQLEAIAGKSTALRLVVDRTN
jgi:cytochrome c-type biogenesis protein CcmH